MSDGLNEVLEILNLERLEKNLFRGQSQDFGSGNVFGGQVLGQALIAAARTIKKESSSVAHSLHAYFLLPGDMKAPIVYDVDRIRDGRSFDTRRVRAIQHGRPIFNMSASFQRIEEGLEHQTSMPDVPGPEELLNEQQLRQQSVALKKLPADVQKRFLRDRSVETRPIEQDIDSFFKPQKRKPESFYWLRADSKLPDDLEVHQALLAYASDMGLLGTSMRPHGISYMHPRFQAASLDHAMWFHRPFRIDEWLLYATDSPISAGARGFNRGSVYTRDGVLVASTAQEGLLRLHDKEKAASK